MKYKIKDTIFNREETSPKTAIQSFNQLEKNLVGYVEELKKPFMLIKKWDLGEVSGGPFIYVDLDDYAEKIVEYGKLMFTISYEVGSAVTNKTFLIDSNGRSSIGLNVGVQDDLEGNFTFSLSGMEIEIEEHNSAYFQQFMKFKNVKIEMYGVNLNG